MPIRQECVTAVKTSEYTGLSRKLEGELARLQDECLNELRRSATMIDAYYQVIDVRITPVIYTFVPNTLTIVVSGTMIIRFGS